MSKQTQQRSLRVGSALWDAFLDSARAQGSNASQLLREKIIATIAEAGVHRVEDVLAKDAIERLTGGGQ